MKHCGRNTLGRDLAEEWGCPFYNVDDLIENAFRAEECRSMTVRQILAHYGEEGFKKREERAVFDLYSRLREADSEAFRLGQSPGDYVVSLGGSTSLNPKHQPILRRMGLNIFLRIDASEAWKRTISSGVPSFLTGSDPKNEFLRLYREKERLCEERADLTIRLNGLSRKDSLEKITEALEERGYFRKE
jgi:shikimate kinase